jgi:hypothetical protein
LLVERHGFDPSLVSAAGYSEYRPVSQNSTTQGRADNRRVDLVVVGRSAEKDKMAQAAAPPIAASPIAAPKIAAPPVSAGRKPSPAVLQQVSAPPNINR